MGVESSADPPAVLEDLRQIQNAVKRSASLTSQLLAFSRRQVRVPRALNLNQLISEMTKMLDRVIGEISSCGVACGQSVERESRFGPDSAGRHEPRVERKRRDAHGGRLTLATANALEGPDQGFRHPHDFRHGAWHGSGDAFPSVRTVFHDQAGRKRNRPGTLHRVRIREAERRNDILRQPRRRRDYVRILLPRSDAAEDIPGKPRQRGSTSAETGQS